MDNIGKKLNKKKGKKKREIKIFPLYKITWSHLPRVAMVQWGRGGVRQYRLDFLSNYDLRNFWHMSLSEKVEYLDKFFDRHHRKPRCQKGQTVASNLSYVDRLSHVRYNAFISVVAKWSGLGRDVERVLTEHIDHFLRKVYPSLDRLFTHQKTHKLRSLESILNKKGLGDFSSLIIGATARWANVRSDAVHMADVRRFIESVYPPLKRLALDHELNKLRSPKSFAKTLNKIWLPVNEPITFS